MKRNEKNDLLFVFLATMLLACLFSVFPGWRENDGHLLLPASEIARRLPMAITFALAVFVVSLAIQKAMNKKGD